MAPSQIDRTRDRISVDLHGLKSAVAQRAQDLGVSPSDLVRAALASALQGQPFAPGDLQLRPHRAASSPTPAAAERVRLCVRMRREQARAAVFESQRHRLSLGDYLAGLVVEVPILTSGGNRDSLIAELHASNAELSTLSRNLHRLTTLLRQADVASARPDREMLDTVAADVRRHLTLAASALAELQPRNTGVRSPERSAR